MSEAMAIAEQLRQLPDLEPPADGWRRLERRVRVERLRRRGRHALAASVAVMAIGIMVAGILGTEPTTPVAPSAPSFRPLIVAAPVSRAEAPADDPELLALQARSRNLKRYLSDLSAGTRIVSADQAGVIAELEDRIAAVDYQLNHAVLTNHPSAADTTRREIAPAAAPELWRRRVAYMDQLMQAHFVETGETGF